MDNIDEYEDFNIYNGEAVHDMLVDFDLYENTGASEIFDEADIDEFVNSLDDWD